MNTINTQTAVAIVQQTNDQETEREDKGPISRLPKFSNKSTEDFVDWYDDVLSILCHSEWKNIYDKTILDIIPTTTLSTSKISEHLYTALRLSLQGDAGLLMKSSAHRYRNLGIEYLHAMKPIFHPKWAPSEVSTKISAFYAHFRQPTATIDQYASHFKRMVRELAYNNVSLPPSQMSQQFIQGLGPEFMTIRNLPTLPIEFQSTDIDDLTAVARTTLANIKGNRDMQQRQRAITNGSRPPAPAPAPSTNPSGSSSAPAPSPSPSPSAPPSNQQDTRTDWQKEIMREIGFHCHTQARQTYWQSLTSRNFCYYHRTSTHTSQNCTKLRTSIDKAQAGTPPTRPFVPNPTFQAPPPPPSNTIPPSSAPPPPSQPSTSQAPSNENPPVARRVQHSVEDVDSDNSNCSITNNNTDADYYLSSHSKPRLFKFIADSGANRHMVNSKDLFITYSPVKNAKVKLGDATKVPIHGIGTIEIITPSNHKIRLHSVLHVPLLDQSLFSIKTHMKYQGCSEHSENNICTLAFPTFTFDTTNSNELEFHLTPPPAHCQLPVSFDSTNAIEHKTHNQHRHYQHRSHHLPTQVEIAPIRTSSPIEYLPRRATQKSAGYDLHSPLTTSIPPQSRKLIPLGFSISIPVGTYGRIAPRSGLALKHNIDIGAGVVDPDYRGEVKVLLINNSQRKFQIHKGDRIAQMIFECCASPAFRSLASLSSTSRDQGGFGSTGIANFASAPSSEPTDIPIQQQLKPKLSEPLLNQDPPPVRTIDKPDSSSPKEQTFTIDQLHKYFGFRNTKSILPHLRDCFQPNFHISLDEPETILNLGDTATIDKTKLNKTPVKLPPQLGDVLHIDIGYGCTAGIGGIKYCLFAVDRATRQKFIYPIKSLQDDILPSLQHLVTDLKRPPGKIVTDFDSKLMGQAPRRYLHSIGTQVEAAPPRHQNQNGLVERNWRSVIRMARSWLTSALLPSSFWYFAIKRAVETSNYLPIKANGIITTPHELAYHIKPNMHALFPMFSLGYIDKPYDSTSKRESFTSQSLRVIAVGRSNTSNSLQFFHPPTQQLLTSAQYRLDPVLASGPVFNLHFDGGLFFNKYTNSSDTLHPPSFAPDQIIFFRPKANENTYTPAKILHVPQKSSDIYTIQRLDNFNIIQIREHRMHSHNPNATPNNVLHQQSNILPTWIKSTTPVTLFTPTMTKPQRGTLRLHDNDEWYFHYGRTNKQPPLHLVDFTSVAHKMVTHNELTRGHPPFHKIYDEMRSTIFKESVARHISAAGLNKLEAPTLLQMKNLDYNDKKIWSAGYDEEYDGLQDLPAWTEISESEYQQIRHVVGNALPAMAISTLKYDEQGKPKRAKWRIVALGNLDPHEWDSNACFAPVISLLEIRMMASLAVHHKRVLKNADFKQAFVQAVLPDDEKYVLKPPPGCPRTNAKTYWLLKRTLYGLKRSPRHWLEKASALLAKCGLKPTKHNPCLFVGKPDGKNTLYLGLYIDDICYFSCSDECEKLFESKISEHIEIDFMGPISHFLGLKFHWIHHDDGNIDVKLSQTAFAEQLIFSSKLQDALPVDSPYRSGLPIDSIPSPSTPNKSLITKYRSLVGSLLWLSQATRPDLATVVSLLAQHQRNPSPGHIKAAKHVIRYVKNTVDEGIIFSSRRNTDMEAFLQFPISPDQLLPLTDANWGSQDQSLPGSKPVELERFKTRSMSGFIIFFNGPVHWCSKRQRITARSSAEAEIYATDECVKELLRLKLMTIDMGIYNIYFKGTPIQVYNDNNACVCWSKSTTTKGLRYMTIRENAIRESVDDGFIQLKHIAGKINLSDLFTKEMKDTAQFKRLRDIIMKSMSSDKIEKKTSMSFRSSPLHEKGGVETPRENIHVE